MRGIICQRTYALLYQVLSLKIETHLGLSRSPAYSWYIWVQASFLSVTRLSNCPSSPYFAQKPTFCSFMTSQTWFVSISKSFGHVVSDGNFDWTSYRENINVNGGHDFFLFYSCKSRRKVLRYQMDNQKP